MIIVKPTAELVWITPNSEKMIELAGRTCYKSEDAITEDSSVKFVEMIMKRGHESVLEHASASVRFVCDRGVTHELVRHRLCAFSQESTRYCNYGKEKFGGEISVIEPPELTEQQFMMWQETMFQIEEVYLKMISQGVSPQIARSVLPNCLKTEIVTTANLREWRHIFKLRRSMAAHPQIKEVMNIAFDLLYKECPTVFKDLVQ